MFIYTNNENDIDSLKAFGFPLMKVESDGTHVFADIKPKEGYFNFSSLEEVVFADSITF